MKPSDVPRAVAATKSSASALDLRVDDAVVLHDSNRLAVRLLPCDALARVAHVAHQAGAEFEVEIARRLAESDSPVAALEPRVEPRVYVRDGFAITLWTYYEAVPPQDIAPAEYAQTLERHHAGIRQIDLTAPHFTDRVAEAQWLVGDRALTPELDDTGRTLLGNTLRGLRRAIVDRGVPEQLLHQEQRTKAIFNVVLGAIASISLLVGGIGIMNIMLASVLERIREIGVRRAVGATRRDVLLQFLSEAILISIAGGVAGILFGTGLSAGIRHFAGIQTIVSYLSVVVAFGVSISVGIAFGIMPAYRAARQDPVICLRYE